jgi:NTE family protein
MTKVGLVLGGGGITGASYHLGTLLALEMATGWHPSAAEVVIGTSCGAFTAAMLRGGQLSVDTFLDGAHSRDDATKRLRNRIYTRSVRPSGVVRWLRRGVLPGLTRPDLRLVAGSPALYSTEGVADWVEEKTGPLANSWPTEATVIVGFDLKKRQRTAFGTDAAPDVPLKLAVAASIAIPMVFEPVQINGRWYADGGIATGTSADLLLGYDEPLDLVIIVAPMAASESRPGARFYEDAFDRAGRAALSHEVERLRIEWPQTDIVVFRPDDRVLAVTRPNPLSTKAAVPAFLRTLRSLKDELARPETWKVLERHLMGPGA